jgi:hypothetical protein
MVRNLQLIPTKTSEALTPQTTIASNDNNLKQGWEGVIIIILSFAPNAY